MKARPKITFSSTVMKTEKNTLKSHWDIKEKKVHPAAQEEVEKTKEAPLNIGLNWTRKNCYWNKKKTIQLKNELQLCICCFP